VEGDLPGPRMILEGTKLTYSTAELHAPRPSSSVSEKEYVQNGEKKGE